MPPAALEAAAVSLCTAAAAAAGCPGSPSVQVGVCGLFSAYRLYLSATPLATFSWATPAKRYAAIPLARFCGMAI